MNEELFRGEALLQTCKCLVSCHDSKLNWWPLVPEFHQNLVDELYDLIVLCKPEYISPEMMLTVLAAALYSPNKSRKKPRAVLDVLCQTFISSSHHRISPRWISDGRAAKLLADSAPAIYDPWWRGVATAALLIASNSAHQQQFSHNPDEVCLTLQKDIDDQKEVEDQWVLNLRTQLTPTNIIRDKLVNGLKISNLQSWADFFSKGGHCSSSSSISPQQAISEELENWSKRMTLVMTSLKYAPAPTALVSRKRSSAEISVSLGTLPSGNSFDELLQSLKSDESADDPNEDLMQYTGLVIESGADELGRCFVAQTISSCDDGKDPFLLGEWHQQSRVLKALHSDLEWKQSPSSNMGGGVGSCLSKLLGLVPVRDALTGIYYADAKMVPNEKETQDGSVATLDLAFAAMVGRHRIVSHRDILSCPGLRGYFIDLWKTLILSGTKCLTRDNLAFICSALVYLMDSKDPADHDDYRDLSQIMRCYADRMATPDNFGSRVCAHMGRLLIEVHPPPSMIDSSGFGPRLFMWLIRSQHLQKHNPTKAVDHMTDGYGLDHCTPMNAEIWPRFIDVLVMANLLVSIYLSEVIHDRTISVLDLLKLTLSPTAHNETLRAFFHISGQGQLMKESFLRDSGGACSECDTPEERWKLTKDELKSLRHAVQQSLVRLVGTERNQEVVIDWMKQIVPIVCTTTTIKLSEKLSLTQFATFFRVALESLRANKFISAGCPVVSDVIETPTGPKYIYMSDSYKTRVKRIKIDDSVEQSNIIARLKQIHVWKFQIKTIERLAQLNHLLPIDPNITKKEQQEQQTKAQTHKETRYLDAPILHSAPSTTSSFSSVASIDVRLLLKSN